MARPCAALTIISIVTTIFIVVAGKWPEFGIGWTANTATVISAATFRQFPATVSITATATAAENNERGSSGRVGSGSNQKDS